MSGITELVEAAHGGALLAEAELRREIQRMLDRGEEGRTEIDRFLRVARPRDWITFDESMRAFWYGERRTKKAPWWRRTWDSLRPAEVGPVDVLVVGLASMDRDGQLREAAVRRLATEPDYIAGSFLALRTTDWVDPVAAAATAALTDRLATDPAALIASAALLFALSDRERASGIDRLVIERAAADAGVRNALMRSTDRRTRRRVIGDAAVRGAATLDELVRLAQTDPDSVVAGTAGVEAVSRSETSDDASAMLDRLLGGPALVRTAVIDALADRGEGHVAAGRHLFDRSPAVRAAAQRAYRRRGADPTVVYRAALEQTEHVPIALAELAHLGSSVDHAAITAALTSDDVATRRAAAGAVRWFAGGHLPDLLTPLLWDPSAGVTRTVERRLRAMARDLDGSMLLDLMAAEHSHSRRAAYRLMRRRSAPERVEADVIAVADRDEQLRRDGVADLRSWLHRGAASASRGDITVRRRLSQRLDAVEHLLRPEDVSAVRFHTGLRPHDLQS